MRGSVMGWRRLVAGVALGLVPLVAMGNPLPVPNARWDHRVEARGWTLSTLEAVQSHGAALVDSVPQDIATFCPGYERADTDQRAAFWVGLFSALAKHESTWNPRARGGGGRYLGLLQIAPATARAYGCNAKSLFDGTENLDCGVRIAARQVARSGLVAGGPGNWGGLALDWGPMRNAGKRADIAAWTRSQSYCAAPVRKHAASIPGQAGDSSR